MKKHSHGGTLLVVNEGAKRFEENDLGILELKIENEKWKESIDMPITCSPANRYKTHATSKTLQQLEVEYNEENLSNDSTGFWRERLVDLIGQLTSVDGATIINTEFEILGFGAKIEPINTEDKPEAIIINQPFENASEENKKLSDLGGTRHKSTAQFVYDQKDAIALVASQDGRISMMFWDERKSNVQVILHAEYLFI